MTGSTEGHAEVSSGVGWKLRSGDVVVLEDSQL